MTNQIAISHLVMSSIFDIIYLLFCILFLDSSFTSVQLTIISIKQNIGIFNFMVMQSPDLSNIEEYLVTVSPPPPIGPDELTTASSALISLENSTQYYIAIFVRACPERFNRTFVFGKITNTQ